ncbi:MAG: leucine-rich repeat protein [Erysipelotrichaceae bacterium]|nr:leucine-rich repeat protein [Erysipelotrichaceae bacterium]
MKRILSVVLSALMCLNVLTENVLAEELQTENAGSLHLESSDSSEYQTVSDSEDEANQKELFSEFTNHVFGISEDIDGLSETDQNADIQSSSITDGSNLSGYEKTLYHELELKLQEIADGTLTSTVFEFPMDSLGMCGPFTAADLGIEAIIVDGAFAPDVKSALSEKLSIDLNAVMSTLRNNYPYELFWYDSTAGSSSSSAYRYGASYENGEWVVTLTDAVLSVSMSVSADYSAGEYQIGNVIETVHNAAAAAKDIVNKYAAMSDYEKLDAYRAEICTLTDYNHEAADDDTTPYGDPWQLIYVFDSQPETTVVCEGYAKAFKYLCDQSSFSNDMISCSLVSGFMDGGTGAGRHMWNVVTMEDGRNYLADITNCDDGSVGYPSELFLKGYDVIEMSKSWEDYDSENNLVSYDTVLYGFDLNGSPVNYWYGLNTENLYQDADLEISDSDYGFAVVIENEPHYLAFASDRHAQPSAISQAMSGINDIYPEQIEYVSMIGDMTGAGSSPGSSGFAPGYSTETIYQEIAAVFPWLTRDQTSIIWADHDGGAIDDAGIMKVTENLYASPYTDPSSKIYTGYNEDGSVAYYIYGIGYYSMLNRMGTAPEAAAEFVRWAESLDDPRTPIIVLCHVPIHAKRGDNYGAVYWNDALNEVATGGNPDGGIQRHVVFLHGHNHTVESAEYYYEPGSTILVQSPGGSAGIRSKINYTYITAGYLKSLQTKNATVVGIDQDMVTFTKFHDSVPVALGEATPITIQTSDLTFRSDSGSALIDYTAYYYEDVIQPDSVSFEINNDESGVISSLTDEGQIVFSGNGGNAVISITCEYNGYVQQNFLDVRVIALSGTCGDNLTWTFDYDQGILNISGTGTMNAYTSSSSPAPWNYFKDLINEVVINSGVTSIGAYAFYGCNAMTSVTIPSSLTASGSSAFNGCTSLQNVNISDIGSWVNVAFSGYTSNPVYYAKSLQINHVPVTDAVIPSGITSIKSYAFYNMTSLQSIVISSSVTTIESYAFYNCTSLGSVDIPSSVTSLGSNAFYGCTGLTEVNLPSGLTEIGMYSFYNCKSLEAIDIPSTVTSIPTSVFSGCTSLKEVNLPSGLTEIGSYVFQGCTSLEEITLPVTLTNIALYAFSSCTSLTHISLPDSVETLGSYVFQNCTAMTEATLSNAMTSISTRTFSGCTSLEKVFIPAAITSIGTYAFYNCSSLSDVYYTGSDWSAVTVSSNNTPLTDAVLHIATAGGSCGDYQKWIVYTDGSDTILEIMGSGEMTDFEDTSSALWADHKESVTKTVINDYVDTLGSYAYYGFSSLTGAYVNSVEHWLRIKFGNTYANPLYEAGNLYVNGSLLTNLVIPENITEINAYAFYGCTSIQTVRINSNLRRINSSAFSANSSLTGVYIDSIEDWLKISFANGTANPVYNARNLYVNDELLSDLVVPAGITAINAYAFYGCTSLQTAVIPEGVTYMGAYAFTYCSNLSHVVINEGISTIGMRTFYGCSKLQDITIPTSLNTVQPYAFEGCGSLSDVYFDGLEEQRNIMISSRNTALTSAVWHYLKHRLYITDYIGCDISVTADDGQQMQNGDIISKDQFLNVVLTIKPGYELKEEFIKEFVVVVEEEDLNIDGSEYVAKIADLLNLEELLNGTANYLDTILFNEESMPAIIEEARANGMSITVEIEESTIEPDAYETELIMNEVNDDAVIDWHDIRLIVYVNGIRTGSISSTSEPVTVLIPLSENLTAAMNETRIIRVIRIHNGEAETLECTLSEDGNSVIFETDKFSTYAIVAETPAETGPITLEAVSLTLTGNIGVNFTFDIPEEERSDTYISFTLNENTERFSAENAEADENGLLRFTALAAAKEMRDPITVRVENEAGDLKQFESNGAAFDGTFTYTVENYFKSVRKNYSNLTELLNLVNAMDTYGKYAQINFKYNTEGMEAPDALGTVDPADLEQFKAAGTGSVTGITVSSISLSLESDTGVKAYFTVDAGHSIDEYVIKADDADVELTAAEGLSNTYYAQLKGAAAKDLDEAINITITNHDETETQSITYYPLSYVRSIIKNSASYETRLVDVCKALYFYWVNTEAYFAAQQPAE